MRARPVLIVLAAALLFLAGGIAAFPVARGYWRSREQNQLTIGRDVAERAGCLACHGLDGRTGIPNPGKGGRRIPGWSLDALARHAQDAGEVREWIADGMPKRRREEKAKSGSGSGEGRIAMPAYADAFSPEEIDAVTAYVMAVAGFGPGPVSGTAEARGRDAARAHGCFACHGVDGAGLVSNPGSLKGYIPGWRGPDYAELVASEAELREWILDGVAKRFADDPSAERWLTGQKTQMPPYRGVLSDEELEAIVAYVKSLRR